MNPSGLPDPTAEKAISRADRQARRQKDYRRIRDVINALNEVASLHGLEIVRVRDRMTGKEWGIHEREGQRSGHDVRR